MDFVYKGQLAEIINDARILIIDDSKFARLTLRTVFEKYGFKNIEEAEDGKKGIKKTKEFNPHLVMLDINMPVMDGIEYCKAIRKIKKFEDIAILVQTGLNTSEEKNIIFCAGASDYISKPIDAREVIARSFIHLERVFMIMDMKLYRDRIAKELESARKIQELSMPGKNLLQEIYNKYDLRVYSHFKSSSEMGGDFWGIKDLGGDMLAIYNIDFSGHGIDAALNTFRMQALINSSEEHDANPGNFLAWLNKKIIKMLDVNQYATMFYGVIDFRRNELVYSCAACPPVIMLKGKSKKCETIIQNGFPIGINENADYSSYSVPFEKGDLLFLYSDAIVETEDEKGKFLSEEALVKKVKGMFSSGKHNESLSEFVNFFYTNYGKNLKDDLTISLYYRD